MGREQDKFESQTTCYGFRKPTCPYEDCGEDWEPDGDDLDGNTVTCPRCRREYVLQAEIEITYASFKLREEPHEPPTTKGG